MAKGLKAKNMNLLLDGPIVLKIIAYMSTEGKNNICHAKTYFSRKSTSINLVSSKEFRPPLQC